MTLTPFDNELKKIECLIKEKKHAASDANLQSKTYEHDMQALTKEKAATADFVVNLEKRYVLLLYAIFYLILLIMF